MRWAICDLRAACQALRKPIGRTHRWHISEDLDSNDFSVVWDSELPLHVAACTWHSSAARTEALVACQIPACLPISRSCSVVCSVQPLGQKWTVSLPGYAQESTCVFSTRSVPLLPARMMEAQDSKCQSLCQPGLLSRIPLCLPSTLPPTCIGPIMKARINFHCVEPGFWA